MSYNSGCEFFKEQFSLWSPLGPILVTPWTFLQLTLLIVRISNPSSERLSNLPAGFQLISKIMGTQQLLLFSFHQCSSRFIPICAFFTIFVLPSNMHDYLTFFSKLTLCIMFNFFLSSIHEIMNLMCLLYDMYVILTILLCVYAQSLSCADTFLFFFFVFFFVWIFSTHGL